MDWESLYCPSRRCRYYGYPFSQGQLVRNGSSHGHKQARCGACGTNVSIRYGTAYLDLHADPAIFEMAVRALAEGNSIRAAARIMEVDKDTVCAWLDRAAQHCRLVMLYLWRDFHVLECQLDELWGFVHTKQRHLPCNAICPLLGFTMRPMAMYGCGWLLHRCGGSCWLLSLVSGLNKARVYCSIVSVTSRIRTFRFLPVISCPSIDGLCCMPMACCINRHATGIEAAIPNRFSCHHPSCCTPRS